MKLSEFQRLKKFLMLAANNDSDAEAIRAFRLATEIIRTHGYTWEQVMDRRVTVLSEVETASEERPGVEELEEHHFETALEDASPSFSDTLRSIRRQWREGRNLTPRQRAVVIEAAARTAARGRAG